MLQLLRKFEGWISKSLRERGEGRETFLKQSYCCFFFERGQGLLQGRVTLLNCSSDQDTELYACILNPVFKCIIGGSMSNNH